MPAFYQGLFLAPTVVSSAVQGAVFAAACYEKLGFWVVPGAAESRHDIIQAWSWAAGRPWWPSARASSPPPPWTAM